MAKGYQDDGGTDGSTSPMRKAERAGTGQPREEQAQGISMSVSTQEGCKKKRDRFFPVVPSDGTRQCVQTGTQEVPPGHTSVLCG